MPNMKHSLEIANCAADIMFSAEYYELLREIYSRRDSIAEFEGNPKEFLVRRILDFPAEVTVVVHSPGDIGRPARIDFHWPHAKNGPAATEAARRRRQLAGAAWHFLHSPEMNAMKARVNSSLQDAEVFAQSPRAFAAANGVSVPEGLEIVVHLKKSGPPRVDIHFGSLEPADIVANAIPVGAGCCYCEGNYCCWYQEF